MNFKRGFMASRIPIRYSIRWTGENIESGETQDFGADLRVKTKLEAVNEILVTEANGEVYYATEISELVETSIQARDVYENG